jgi:hypothetical protein
MINPTIIGEKQLRADFGFYLNSEVIFQLSEFRLHPLWFLGLWNPARIEEVFGPQGLDGSSGQRAGHAAVHPATDTTGATVLQFPGAK